MAIKYTDRVLEIIGGVNDKLEVTSQFFSDQANSIGSLLQKLIPFSEFDSSDDELENEQPDLELTESFNDLYAKCPFTFNLSDGDVVSLIGEDGSRIKSVSQGPDGPVYRDFIVLDNGVIKKVGSAFDISGVSEWSLDELIDSVTDQFTSNGLYATANRLLLDGNFNQANFLAAAQTLLGSAKGVASETYEMIVSVVTQDAPDSFFSLVGKIASSVNDISIEDGTMDYSSVDYSISTSYWAELAGVVLSVASVVAAIADPLIGIALGLVGQAASAFYNIVTASEEWRIDETSPTTQFVIPILQGWLWLSDLASWSPKIHSIVTNGQVAKMKIPCVDLYYWMSKDPAKVACEAFFTMDRNTIPVNSDGVPLIDDVGEYAWQGRFITYGVNTGEAWDAIMYGSSPINDYTDDSDMFNRLLVGVAMTLRAVSTPAQGFLWDEGQADLTTMDGEYAFKDVITWAKAGNAYTSGRLVKLVNEWIPKFRSKHSLTGISRITESWGNKYWSIITPMTGKTERPRFYPPKRSKGTLVRAVIVGTAIVAVSYLAYRAVRVRVANYLTKRAFNKKQMLTTAVTNWQANPSTENFVKMNRARRRFSRVSNRLNGLGVLPVAAANNSVSASTSEIINSLKELQGSTGDATIADVLRLIGRPQ